MLSPPERQGQRPGPLLWVQPHSLPRLSFYHFPGSSAFVSTGICHLTTPIHFLRSQMCNSCLVSNLRRIEIMMAKWYSSCVFHHRNVKNSVASGPWWSWPNQVVVYVSCSLSEQGLPETWFSFLVWRQASTSMLMAQHGFECRVGDPFTFLASGHLQPFPEGRIHMESLIPSEVWIDPLLTAGVRKSPLFSRKFHLLPVTSLAGFMFFFLG